MRVKLLAADSAARAVSSGRVAAEAMPRASSLPPLAA